MENCGITKKPKNYIGLVLGIIFVVIGIYVLLSGTGFGFGGIIPLVIGASLCYLFWSRSRTALLVFGHATVVMGCFLVTWGIYLLPYSQPTLMDIIGRPLFWGLFSIMGGICAIYHGFCNCVRRTQ